MKRYSITQFFDHMQQALADSLAWHQEKFQTARERQAFEAGFQQGAGDARNAISLHGGYQLADRVRERNAA